MPSPTSAHWEVRRARYRGTRRTLFDLRRVAVIHNRHVITRQVPPATTSWAPDDYLTGALSGRARPRTDHDRFQWHPRSCRPVVSIRASKTSEILLRWAYAAAGPVPWLCLVTGWPLLKRPHVAVGVTEI